MSTPHASPLAARLLAAVVLTVFLAASCGSSVTDIATDRAVESPAAVAPSAAPSNPNVSGNHGYGATLEEWTKAKEATQAAPGDDKDNAAVVQSDYTEVEWGDLIPVGFSGDEVIARFDDELAAVEPGSPEAKELYLAIQEEFDTEAVNDNLDGVKIRMAGFVAPLTYDDDIVTEFLLVPTLGACIHVPPPPPNQTVMVSVDRADGLTVEESWGAVWVEGTLVIEAATTDLAPASYKIVNATSRAYDEV